MVKLIAKASENSFKTIREIHLKQSAKFIFARAPCQENARRNILQNIRQVERSALKFKTSCVHI